MIGGCRGVWIGFSEGGVYREIVIVFVLWRFIGVVYGSFRGL